MPTYSAVASDGKEYEIEGPAGANQAEILTAIENSLSSSEESIERQRAEYLAYLRDREEVQPEPKDESLFTTNIGRGVDQLQQAYGSALEGVGSVTGLEGLEQYGTDVVEENRRQLEETAGAARSTEDIDSLGGLADYAAATFGAQVPQLGSTLAGSAAGAKLGAALGSVVPGIGTMIGGTAGSLIGGIAANLPYFYGSNRAAQKEEVAAGNKQEVSEAAAALTAIPQSVLDFIADRFLVSGFLGKAIKGGGIFTRAAKGVGKGIVTEVPTEIGQQVLERVQAGQDLTSDEALDEYFEVGVAAGLIGGTVSGAGNIYGGRRDPSAPTAPAEEQLALPAPDGIAGLLPPPSVFDESGAIRGQDETVEQLALSAPPTSPEPEGIAGLLSPPTAPTDPETGAILVDDKTGVVVPEAPDREDALRSEIVSNTEEITKLKNNIVSEFETGAPFDVMSRIKTLEERNALLFRDAEARKNAIPVDDPRFAKAEEQKRQQVAETARLNEEEMAPIAAGDLRQVVGEREAPDTALGQALQEAAAAPEVVATPEVDAEVSPEVDVEASPEFIRTQASLPGMGKSYAERFRDRRKDETGPSGGTTGGRVPVAAESDGQAVRTSDEGSLGRADSDIRTTPETLEDSATPTVVDIESVTPSDDAGEGGSASELGEAGTEDSEAFYDKILKPITKEAQDFLAATEQGFPSQITSNLKRIAEENDVKVINVEQIIADLKAKTTKAETKRPAASAVRAVKPKPKITKAKTKRPAASKIKAISKPKKPSPQQKYTREQAAARKEQGYTKVVQPKGVEATQEVREALAVPFVEGAILSINASEVGAKNLAKHLSGPFVPVTEESLEQETTKKGRTKGQNEALKAFTEAWGDTASSNLKVFVELAGVRSYMHARLGAALQRNPDPLTEEDIQKVRGLLEGAKGDPKLFFSRSPDPVNGLVEIAYALTGGKKTNLGGMTAIEREYFQGLNSESAGRALSWVKSNLSDGAYNWAIAYNADIVGRPSVEKVLQATKTTPEDTKYLAADAVAAVDVEAHPMMGAALRQGDIKSALRIIAATTANKRLANIATRLGNKLGDTKVEIVENLVDEVGVPMAGRFVPTTNTIQINPATGFNIHTVLHETTHALTSATLANKSHPTTKKLQKLFDEIQDSIGDVYGSRNLDEFVAETFGNHEFQRLLGGINPKGGIVTALQRFANTITNFIRSNILRIPTKAFKPDSVLDKTDKLVNAILAPAPQYRDAGAMNLDAASVINRMGEFAKGIGKPTAATRKAFLKSVGNFFDNVMIDAAAKKLVAYTASGQALAEMAKRYGINSGYELETTIREQGGAQWKAALALDATTTNLVNWLKGQSDTNKKALFRLIHTSTREQVDPYADRSKYEGNKVKLQVWEDMNKKGGT